MEMGHGASIAPKRLQLATGLVWHRDVKARKQLTLNILTGKSGQHVLRNVVEVRHNVFAGLWLNPKATAFHSAVRLNKLRVATFRHAWSMEPCRSTAHGAIGLSGVPATNAMDRDTASGT